MFTILFRTIQFSQTCSNSHADFPFRYLFPFFEANFFFTRNKIPGYSQATSLNSGNVWTIKDDNKGHLLLGTHNAGLAIFNKESGRFDHYTFNENDPEVADALAALEKAQGFFRSEIGKRLRLRIVPHIRFYYDSIPEHAQHMEELINKALNS